MLLDEIVRFIKSEIAPKEFRFDSEIYGYHYGAYDDNRFIKKVMLTVDLSLKALYFGIKNKINLIISLNGLISNPIKNFKPNLVNKLSILSKFPISIFVLGFPFYIVEGGIIDLILEALFLKLDHPFEIKNPKGFNIPVGRLCIPEIYPNSNELFTLEKLINRIESNLNIQPILYVGELRKEITNVCIISGGNIFLKYFDEILTQGCDCYITEKINKSLINYVFDLGFNLIEFSFFNCERLALQKLSNILSLKFPYDDFYVFNSINPLKPY
jgi:putative NIF3 family GTP cyclohydrolase 1 type 2